MVSFLYVLLRDHLPAGAVESIVREHVEKSAKCIGGLRTVYSNEFLEAYARELANRIAVEKKFNPEDRNPMTDAPCTLASGGFIAAPEKPYVVGEHVEVFPDFREIGSKP
jgi:hypothetical protein